MFVLSYRIRIGEKNVLEQMYFQKSLSFIKSELELLEKQMMYPKLFIQKDDGFTSDLYLDTNEVSYVLSLIHISEPTRH